MEFDITVEFDAPKKSFFARLIDEADKGTDFDPFAMARKTPKFVRLDDSIPVRKLKRKKIAEMVRVE